VRTPGRLRQGDDPVALRRQVAREMRVLAGEVLVDEKDVHPGIIKKTP
jgi:hypothetical protein